jgi:hypothetical protein
MSMGPKKNLFTASQAFTGVIMPFFRIIFVQTTARDPQIIDLSTVTPGALVFGLTAVL